MEPVFCFGKGFAMKQDEYDRYAVEVGQRLAKARKAIGLKQKDLAGSLGISTQQLSNYERGQHMLPPNYIPKIFLLTKIDSNYLYLGHSDGLPRNLYSKLESEAA